MSLYFSVDEDCKVAFWAFTNFRAPRIDALDKGESPYVDDRG